MREFTYYFINLLIFLPPLVLSFATDIKPHRHIKGLMAGYIFVSLPILVLSYFAVKNGIWVVDQSYTAGPLILGLPLELVLFLLTIPFAMIYVWGMVKKFIGDIELPGIIPLLILGLTGASSVWLLVNYWSHGYTQAVAIATLLMILIALFSRIVFTLRFWTFQAILLGIVLIFNSVLTTLPMVTYNSAEVIGFKIAGIPVEDFMYAFAFINLFLFAFIRADYKKIPKTT